MPDDQVVTGPTAGPAVTATRRPLPMALIAAARPRQWVKNLLVFAAPAAAGVIGERTALLQTVAAFACFCLASSGTYYLNDAADVDADRLHPKKQFRPIAAGDLSVGLARVIGAVAIITSVGLAALVDWNLAAVIGAYVATTTAYSLWLKHVAVVDVVVVAAG
ncbi:MAG: UbiA family prenyltransferase, partial [Aquihabitans sp.]